MQQDKYDTGTNPRIEYKRLSVISNMQSRDGKHGQTPKCACLLSFTKVSHAVIFGATSITPKDTHALSSSPASAHAQWILFSTH